MSAKPFWTHSLLSIVDQVLLSGLNFAVGMCLIRFGTKSDYGLYSQLFAAALFAVGVLEAMIGSPLTTLAPQMRESQQALVIQRLQRFQVLGGSVLGVVMGAAAAWVVATRVPEVSAGPVGLAFAVFIVMTTLREYRRTVWFLHADMASLLRSDGVYVVSALLGGGLLIVTEHANAASVLATLSLAQALAWLAGRSPAPVPPDAEPEPWRHTLAQIWDKGRWAVPGTAVGWLGNYSFLYLASALSGVEAAAEVSASRLLLVPVGLMVVAWSRVARPLAGRLIHARDWRTLNRLTWRSLGGIELLSLAYIGLLVLGLPWLQTHVLGAKYQGINTLVWAWGAYFVVSVARTIATTWLVSMGAFRQLFIEGCVVVVVMMAVAGVLIPRWGALGAVLALIVMETVDTLLLLVLLHLQRRRLNREPALG
ncbi:hypothetical protein PSQ39_09330 [Curvibacter sp. HBC28]|uniref:Polysaccharide biosynthesis protein n=1 Tax=Curvibacter microcysteis TaxID=3026419 RepID=A0ABT5ME18_9BURK|nr:hypothetical protein [Curvibacter sp. HBC28]MDD0814828.1 hypothetical protein [Curvibacter sp. HBC28]